MKKLKNLLSILLVLLLVVGCGTEGEAPKDGGNKTEGTVETKDKMVVIINTNLGDKAFSDLVWSGVTKAAEENNLEAKAIELMGDATKQEPTLNEVSEGEYGLVISGTFNLKEATEKAAGSHPDQKYLVYDTQLDYTDGKFPNVASVMSKQNEGSFLAGYLAAKMTQLKTDQTNEEKIIGFVGGGENSAINDFLIGYIQGAKYADPEVKILFSYIGNFQDTATGKELALAQYSQGADIVFAVAGSASLGVLDASKDANKFSIGVDQDHAMKIKDTDPDTSEHIITSVKKNLDVIIAQKIKEYVEGTIEWGTHTAAGIKENGMSLADNEYYQKLVPQELRDELVEIEKKIASGEVVVESAIGMTTEQVNVYKERAGSSK